jgi:hypothetical protein
MHIPETTLIAHHDKASEEVTLHSLWEHCRENPSDKVIYLHSKGSFTVKRENDLLRKFLTQGALSKECADLPLTCNVCSSRMSPIPHPHTSGNMWLARCDYVSKLMDPHTFAAAMKQIGAEVVPWCRGSGRYAAEHWIHSHPAARPCDLHTDPAFVWDYSPLPENEFPMELKPAPRYPLAVYVKNQCGKDGQLLQQRLDEYQKLYQVAPTGAWWGWDFFGPISAVARARLSATCQVSGGLCGVWRDQTQRVQTRCCTGYNCACGTVPGFTFELCACRNQDSFGAKEGAVSMLLGDAAQVPIGQAIGGHENPSQPQR